MTKLIILEGSIGSGKSTLLERVSVHEFNKFEHVIIQEPVDEWECLVDAGGTNVLKHFYNDMKSYAFVFQTYILLTRIERIRKTMNENPGKVIICERSPFTDKNIFVTGLKNAGIFNEIEFNVFNHLFAVTTESLQKLHISGIIYMRTSPEVCLKRISTRGREGEDNISPKYLGDLHQAHETWLSTYLNKLVLNGDNDISNAAFWRETMEAIENYIDSLP
jgi:deoxyadenosine/deoxycytidine kinase